MAGWITVNGSHVFLKDGQSVEEALSERQAGTNQENHQAANDGIRKAFQKKKEKSQERTRDVVSHMRADYVLLPNNTDNYKQDIDKRFDDMQWWFDKKVEAEAIKQLSGPIQTKYHGKIKVREIANRYIGQTGYQHIAASKHNLHPRDIKQIKRALAKPKYYVPKFETEKSDTYIIEGRFGIERNYKYLVVHVSDEAKGYKGKDYLITAYIKKDLEKFENHIEYEEEN